MINLNFSVIPGLSYKIKFKYFSLQAIAGSPSPYLAFIISVIRSIEFRFETMYFSPYFDFEAYSFTLVTTTTSKPFLARFLSKNSVGPKRTILFPFMLLSYKAEGHENS